MLIVCWLIVQVFLHVTRLIVMLLLSTRRLIHLLLLDVNMHDQGTACFKILLNIPFVYIHDVCSRCIRPYFLFVYLAAVAASVVCKFAQHLKLINETHNNSHN